MKNKKTFYLTLNKRENYSCCRKHSQNPSLKLLEFYKTTRSHDLWTGSTEKRYVFIALVERVNLRLLFFFSIIKYNVLIRREFVIQFFKRYACQLIYVFTVVVTELILPFSSCMKWRNVTSSDIQNLKLI